MNEFFFDQGALIFILQWHGGDKSSARCPRLPASVKLEFPMPSSPASRTA